jgi:hypothetical protein
MNHEQQDREEKIFLQALEMAPGKERDVWLEEACGGDLDLQRDIKKLLGADDEAAPLFRDTGLGAGASKAGAARGEPVPSKVAGGGEAFPSEL